MLIAIKSGSHYIDALAPALPQTLHALELAIKSLIRDCLYLFEEPLKSWKQPLKTHKPVSLVDVLERLLKRAREKLPNNSLRNLAVRFGEMSPDDFGSRFEYTMDGKPSLDSVYIPTVGAIGTS